jgi:hypothetical protein
VIGRDNGDPVHLVTGGLCGGQFAGVGIDEVEPVIAAEDETVEGIGYRDER